MRIAYILESTELCGGVKVVFQHAELLRALGHDVTVLGRDARPDWISFKIRYFDCSLEIPRIGTQDLVIATYWTTIPIAESLGLGPVIHFCQGFEGDYVHLSSQHAQIEEIYSRNHPAFTVTPHLAFFLKQRFGREAYVIPPPLDSLFRPAFRRRAHRTPWVLIPGIFESEVKGVPTALRAVALLKKSGSACKVVRVSMLPLSSEELQLLKPDEYLHAVHPKVVARRLRHCDLLLLPSRKAEGFGLPMLEAMVSKVPVIASDILATRFVGDGAVTLVPADDPGAFADRARQLLESPLLWREARERGAVAAQRFHANLVSKELAKGIDWAIQRFSGGTAA